MLKRFFHINCSETSLQVTDFWCSFSVNVFRVPPLRGQNPVNGLLSVSSPDEWVSPSVSFSLYRAVLQCYSGTDSLEWRSLEGCLWSLCCLPGRPWMCVCVNMCVCDMWTHLHTFPCLFVFECVHAWAIVGVLWWVCTWSACYMYVCVCVGVCVR